VSTHARSRKAKEKNKRAQSSSKIAVALIKIVSRTRACSPESAIWGPVCAPKRLGLWNVLAFILSRMDVGGHLRKANCKVGVAHAIPALVLHDAVEVEDQGAQRSVIGIGQVVDLLMQSIASGAIVFDPGSVDEGIVSSASEQRLGKITEELLEQGCNRIHVMVEVGRVAEVEVRRVVVEGVT
jgi:hypothetical protein